MLLVNKYTTIYVHTVIIPKSANVKYAVVIDVDMQSVNDSLVVIGERSEPT